MALVAETGERPGRRSASGIPRLRRPTLPRTSRTVPEHAPCSTALIASQRPALMQTATTIHPSVARRTTARAIQIASSRLTHPALGSQWRMLSKGRSDGLNDGANEQSEIGERRETASACVGKVCAPPVRNSCVVIEALEVHD
jgi:hypothetical protein